MAEESEAPEEVQDTPTPEAVAPDQGTRDETPVGDNYEKRYNDLRPEYDRVKQEYSQYRPQIEFLERLQSDESAQEELLRELAELRGYEFPEMEEEPQPLHDPRVDELLQERELDQLEARIESDFDLLSKEHGRTLSDKEKQVLVSHALSISDGPPDVKAAYNDLEEAFSERQKFYVESKGSPQVAAGSPGEKQVDLSDKKARLAFMESRVGANT